MFMCRLCKTILFRVRNLKKTASLHEATGCEAETRRYSANKWWQWKPMKKHSDWNQTMPIVVSITNSSRTDLWSSQRRYAHIHHTYNSNLSENPTTRINETCIWICGNYLLINKQYWNHVAWWEKWDNKLQTQEIKSLIFYYLGPDKEKPPANLPYSFYPQ